MNLRVSGFSFALLLFAWAEAAAIADDSAPKEVILDGLSAVIGGSPSDELSRTLLLVSDVLFQARMLQLIRGAADDTRSPAGDKILLEARRSAIFMRLLAGNARALKETVTPNIVASIREQLAALSGGESQLAALMAQAGYKEPDLTRWIEDGVLASTQMRYVLDQARVEAGPIEDAADHEEDAWLRPTRAGVAQKKAVRDLLRWLENLSTEQRLRILR